MGSELRENDMKDKHADARPIRVGLIGCGFYAQNHLHAWRDLASENAILMAVCDRDEQ